MSIHEQERVLSALFEALSVCFYPTKNLVIDGNIIRYSHDVKFMNNPNLRLEVSISSRFNSNDELEEEKLIREFVGKMKYFFSEPDLSIYLDRIPTITLDADLFLFDQKVLNIIDDDIKISFTHLGRELEPIRIGVKYELLRFRYSLQKTQLQILDPALYSYLKLSL